MKKNIFKRILSMLVVMAFALGLFVACSDDNEEESVTYALSRQTLTLDVGESETLTITPAPTESVVWSSEDSGIASCENGVVTAVAEGTTSVSASFGDHRLSCTVQINEPTAVSVTLELDRTSYTVINNSKFDITASVSSNGTELNDAEIIWTVTDGEADGISLITNKNVCEVTANKSGYYTVTASYAQVTASCDITVWSDNVIQLQSPVLTSNGQTVSWAAIPDAVGYYYYFGTNDPTYTTQTSVDVESHVDTYGTSDFYVYATPGVSLELRESEPAHIVVVPQLYLERAGVGTFKWTEAVGAVRYDVYVDNEQAVSYTAQQYAELDGAGVNLSEHANAASTVYVQAIDSDGTELRTSRTLEYTVKALTFNAENIEDVLLSSNAYSFNSAKTERGYAEESIGGKTSASGGFAWFSTTYNTTSDFETLGTNFMLELTKEELQSMLNLGYTKIVIPMYVTYEKQPQGLPSYTPNSAISGALNYTSSNRPSYNTWFDLTVDLEKYLEGYDTVSLPTTYLFHNYIYTNNSNHYVVTTYVDTIYLS